MNPAQRRAAPLPPGERRAAVISAALPLLTSRGADVTTREIAEAAGIAEGTIFRVFPDKDALISAAVESALDPTTTVHQLDAVDRGLPLEQRLTAVVDICRARLTDVTRLMSALRMFGPPEDHQSRFHRPPFSPSDITQRLTAAMVDVLISSSDELRVAPEFAARILRLFVFSATHPRIADDHPLTTDEIVSVLLDGLRAPRTSPAASAAHPARSEMEHPC